MSRDTNNPVVPYDQARRELAAADTVPALVEFNGRLEAIRVFAQRAGDRGAEIRAMEFRLRAERRLGEMLAAISPAGGRPKKTGAGGAGFAKTLEELGVSRRLAAAARRAAAVPEAEFERRIAAWKEAEARRAATVINSLRKFVARPPAAAAGPLPNGHWPVIYADPPWQYETRSEAGMDRAAANHYPTMDLADIAAMPIAGKATPDSVLLLWAVSTHLMLAEQVIHAWGFQYKTLGFVWEKLDGRGRPIMGPGNWTRPETEVCLLATRGQPKRLNKDVRQLIQAPRREHSRKPDEAYERIERLVAGPWLELFAREPKTDDAVRFRRPGWTYWGNEIRES